MRSRPPLCPRKAESILSAFGKPPRNRAPSLALPAMSLVAAGNQMLLDPVRLRHEYSIHFLVLAWVVGSDGGKRPSVFLRVQTLPRLLA